MHLYFRIHTSIQNLDHIKILRTFGYLYFRIHTFMQKTQWIRSFYFVKFDGQPHGLYTRQTESFSFSELNINSVMLYNSCLPVSLHEYIKMFGFRCFLFLFLFVFLLLLFCFSSFCCCCYLFYYYCFFFGAHLFVFDDFIQV